jgi:hypothetical protein
MSIPLDFSTSPSSSINFASLAASFTEDKNQP